jgi:hypothetical protein
LKAILLILGLLIQQPPQTGVVEGIVLRTQTLNPVPLVNARVVLDGSRAELVARTDSSGRFRFENLLPGRYRLRVTKDGYIRQEYPRAAMGAQGLPIDLGSGQQIRDIVFRLDPAPTISGVIRDRNFAPIAGVVVQALRRGYDTRGNRTLSSITSVKTDDRGVYRLYWVDPGEYIIVATPPPPTPTSQPVGPTYFPGFPSVDDAKPVRVSIGRDAHGTDVRLNSLPIGPVEGAINSMVTGKHVEGSVVLSSPEDGVGVARFQVKSLPEEITRRPPPQRNNYKIPAVPPGLYILTAVSGDLQASQRILVRSNGLVSDLIIGPGVSISGRLTGAGSQIDLRGVRVSVEEVDIALPLPAPVDVAPNGAFVVSSVQPGQYSVTVSGLPGDLYVKNAVAAGIDALEKPFSIGYGGPPAELSIELSADGGQIAGVVYDSDNALFLGAQVTLVPEGVNRLRVDHYRTAVSTKDGTFVLRGIIPGDYRLFAWEDIEPNAYLSSGFMESYQHLGTTVRVAPAQMQNVPLRLITIER